MSRPDDGDGDGGFLGRWARRKQEAKRAPAAPDAETPSEQATPEPSADLPLPSLDDIVPGADASAFFQAHVPEALRKAALRKLWTTDPEISGFIEMADYQWDFNNPDAIPGWGSGLDTATVRRMAGRFLTGETQERGSREPEALAETAPEPLNSPMVETAAPDPAPAAPQPADAAPEPTADYIAPQKTLEQTVVYEPARKRHGGALPS